jgi:DNA-binding transcriptional MerR regulator
MPTYSIKDLENLTGIRAHTIRIWEQRYNLLNPERTPTNIRIYSDKDLRKLLSVALLNNNGLKISKIAHLSDSDITEAVLQLSEGDDTNLESQIENLKLIMVDMNETKFEKTFAHLVLQFGFEEAILNIFVPFFNRLVYLWQTDSVTIAQINFVSALYKQKVYTAIDGLLVPEKPTNKTIIMFLPKGEWLDTGLIFSNYMARKRGYKTLYLGASFPTKELPDILAKNPDSILFSVATLTKTDLTSYYTKILAVCGENQKVMIAGNQTGTVKVTDERLITLKEYADFKDFLDNPQ